MRRPVLSIRFSFFCVEDEIEFRFNERVLPLDKAEITDERALRMATVMAGGMDVQAPFGMSAHFFDFTLELDDLVQGDNVLEIETKRQETDRRLHTQRQRVEVPRRYRSSSAPRPHRRPRALL